MKVCQIGTMGYKSNANGLEEKNIGGIGGYILDLVEVLVENNIKIDFVGKIFFYIKKDKITYYQIQEQLSSTNTFLFKLFIKSFFIKLDKNEIIHAHRPDHLAAFAMFKANKCVVTIHGQQAVTVNKRKGWLVRKIYNILETIALVKADKILVTDKITKEYYKRQYPKYENKIFISPTGVDLSLFRIMDKTECKIKNNYSCDEQLIQYLGRVEAPKKVADIIKAFSIISQDHDKVRLMIIGDGVDLKTMKILVSSLNLSNKVRFMGAVMRENLPELINCADVSVLYSGNEGSPLSIKESLACGVPVVANDVGDIAEVVKDDVNGYIVKNETIDDLAEIMLKCLNESSQLSLNCLESIIPYSKDRVFNQIIDIYKEIKEK